jgi:hypothetical protein
VKKLTSDAELRAPDRPKYSREIPQIKIGIGEKQTTNKKRDIKSVTQYGWGFRFLMKAVYTKKKKKKARERGKRIEEEAGQSTSCSDSSRRNPNLTSAIRPCETRFGKKPLYFLNG